MYFPLIVISSLIISECQVLCEINNLEYSDQYPWPVVYTLYPFYNSEILLEIWRAAKTVDISTDVGTLAPSEQEQTLLHTNDVQQNSTNFNFQNNLSYILDKVKDSNEEQLSKNKQQLSNYQNKHKHTKSSKPIRGQGTNFDQV